MLVGTYNPDLPVVSVGNLPRRDMAVAVSSRADVKLAPCMARPNLFSGD